MGEAFPKDKLTVFSIGSFVQMELGAYPEPIQALLQKLLQAASPSAEVPMHWRYSLMSLAMFLFIMPPVDAASAKVCAAYITSTQSWACTAALDIAIWSGGGTVFGVVCE